MKLNKKKYVPRPKTEKEICNQMFKDAFVFISQYAGILAIVFVVFWMFNVDIDTDFAAILFCMFMAYKQWIKPLGLF